VRSKKVFLYDTTLRDGAQAEDISFSLEDKLRITGKLDEVGVHYIEGGWPGTGNIDVDPLFVGERNYRLRTDSPCLDAGNNYAVPSSLTTDLLGHPRRFDSPFAPDMGLGAAPIVDMGAYESQVRVSLQDVTGLPSTPTGIKR
jgi:hypothetical protein